MVLCPVALAVGCSKCPVFAICPAKGLIGDYKADKDKVKDEPKSGARKRAQRPSE